MPWPVPPGSQVGCAAVPGTQVGVCLDDFATVFLRLDQQLGCEPHSRSLRIPADKIPFSQTTKAAVAVPVGGPKEIEIVFDSPDNPGNRRRFVEVGVMIGSGV